MIGHEPLIRMRLAGVTFSDVWVWIGSPKSLARTWHQFSPVVPHVEIGDNERIEALDFRWCIGLIVHIDSPDRSKALAAHVEASKAGAKMVFTLVGDDLIYNEGKKIALPRRRQN